MNFPHVHSEGDQLDLHTHDHNHRHAPKVDRGNRGRVILAAALTTGFMFAEAIGGWWTGSLALLADAGHMLVDAVALVLAAVAFSLARRPATGALTYGFDRFQVLAAFVNGLSVFVIALLIAWEAALRLREPVPVAGAAMLAIAAAGLVVNIASFLILSGGDRRSLNMRGAILHVAGDLLGSLAAILAALVILGTGWTPADPILSVLVAVILLKTAWSLVRDSGRVLLEGAPVHLDRGAIADDLGRLPGIRDVHHIHLWTLDGEKTIATLHVGLQPDAPADVALRAVKERLAARHGIGHATVEIERAGCADAAPPFPRKDFGERCG